MSNTVCEDSITLFNLVINFKTTTTMCKKTYFSTETAFVFISASTEEKCDKRASKYFDRRGVSDYHASGIEW